MTELTTINGFKVVSILDLVSKYTSCCHNYSFPEEFRTEYKIGEFCYPTIANTKLFAFTDLNEAIQFNSTFHTLETLIFRCEILNPDYETYPVSIFNIKKYWKSSNRKSFKPHPLLEIDNITSCVAGDAIKLIERV